MQFVRNNNLRVENTLSKHNNCVSCKSFNGSITVHVLDHVLINSKASILVKQCKVSTENMMHSDHNYLEITLKWLFNKKFKTLGIKVNFYKVMNNETKLLFNKNFTIKVDNCTDVRCDELCNYMNDYAKEISHEKHEQNKGWFHHSRYLLTPLLKQINKFI